VSIEEGTEGPPEERMEKEKINPSAVRRTLCEKESSGRTKHGRNEEFKESGELTRAEFIAQ